MFFFLWRSEVATIFGHTKIQIFLGNVQIRNDFVLIYGMERWRYKFKYSIKIINSEMIETFFLSTG
jgi:hypothetical protein